MKKAGSVFIIIIAIFLLFAVFGDEILAGLKTWRSNDTTESFYVTTGAGVTTANVTLSYDLFQAALAEVESVSSSNVTDIPVASAYDEDTKHLTIEGLTASISRALTIDYTAETTNIAMRIIGPFLGVLVFGAIIYFIFKKGKQ